MARRDGSWQLQEHHPFFSKKPKFSAQKLALFVCKVYFTYLPGVGVSRILDTREQPIFNALDPSHVHQPRFEAPGTNPRSSEKRLLINTVAVHRLARAISQSKLAGAAGISRQTLSLIEGGKQVPSIEIALALAEALDAPVQDLFRLH